MAISSTKRKRLADPGSGLWLSYSIDRLPGRTVLKRFTDPGEQTGPEEPAVRDRIFTEELRSVTSEVLTHAKPQEAAGREIPSVPAPEPPAAEPRTPEPVKTKIAPVARTVEPESAPVSTPPAAPPKPAPEPVSSPVVSVPAETAPAQPDSTPQAAAPEAAQATTEPASVVEKPAPVADVPVPVDVEKPVPAAEVPAASPAEEAPDIFEFPDKLDDAEEIRLSRSPRPGYVHAPNIDDSLNDYNIDDEEKDEIELEDPPAAERGQIRRPEPVATDSVAKRVPEPGAVAPAQTEVSPAPAAKPEPVKQAEPEAQLEPEPGPAISPHDQVPGRTAIAFQEHQAHERKAEAAHVAESLEGAGLELAPDPLHNEKLEKGEEPFAVQPLPAERIMGAFQQAAYSYPEEFIELFQKLYSARRLKTEQLDPVLEFLLAKSRASAVAWLVLDRKLSAFRPFMDMNLDVNTRKNLYFSLNDKYLPEEEKYEILRFEGSLKNDFHFRKRFSTPFLLGHQGAIVINLNVLQQTSYIILFYRRLPDADILEELEASSLPVIRDLLPAVQRIQEISESGLRSDYDFADRLYQLCREMTHYGKSPLRILHFRFPGILKKSSRNLLMKKLGDVLMPLIHPDERIITLLPGRLVVLLKKTDQIEVEEAVGHVCHRWGVEFKMSSHRYPERGVNLFTYLEPGP